MIKNKGIGIGEKEIPQIAPQVDTFFDEKSKLIFSYKPKSKSYEPIAYNAECNQDGDIAAEEIQENDIFHHFITYIRFSSMVTNKASGEVVSGK